MSNISDDPAKFAPRVRDPKHIRPVRPSTRAETTTGPASESTRPLVQPDQVSVGRHSGPTQAGEDISAAELEALTQQAMELEDDPDGVNRALRNLEDGYDPDKVLKSLVDQMIGEGDFKL